MYKLLIISLNGDPLASYGTEHGGGQVKYILELGNYLVRENWAIDVYTIQNNGNAKTEAITEVFNVIRFPLPNNENYSYSITMSDIEHIQLTICKGSA